MIRLFAVFLISFMFLFQPACSAALWHKDSALGNEITKEEYPDSKDVEPKKSGDDTLVIQGGVETSIDITLEECLKYALGNNPRIQAAMQDVFASDARIRQTWASYFPQFGWQTGYTKIKQLQLSDALGRNLVFNYWVLGQISASQMLYDFGVTQNQVTIRKLDNQGYRITLTSTVNDVICEVKTAYYNLQYAMEAKKVAEDSVARYAAFYDQAKAFYKAGTKPKVDVTIAEVNLSNAKLVLIQAENAVDVAMAKLNNTMGLPYTNKYKVAEGLRYDPCDISLEKAIQIARESRPEFLLADVRVEEARQNVKLIKKSYFPQITIEGQYQIGGMHPTSNYGYNYGGYLNFPTINGMLIKNEIKEAKALYSKEQSNAINTKNDIYYQVQESYYSLTEKKNKIPVATLGVKQAKENYDLSFGRYKVGVGDPIELKEAQVQYQNAMLTYYQTMYDYNTARATLEKNIGKNIANGEVELKQDNCKGKKKAIAFPLVMGVAVFLASPLSALVLVVIAPLIPIFMILLSLTKLTMAVLIVIKIYLNI